MKELRHWFWILKLSSRKSQQPICSQQWQKIWGITLSSTSNLCSLWSTNSSSSRTQSKWGLIWLTVASSWSWMAELTKKRTWFWPESILCWRNPLSSPLELRIIHRYPRLWKHTPSQCLSWANSKSINSQKSCSLYSDWWRVWRARSKRFIRRRKWTTISKNKWIMKPMKCKK